ncbi:MAG: hypothetical protein R3A48_27540 [Polyangiales bacterium]
MRLLARSTLCLGLATSGCAITALVGENPDAALAVDVVAPPFDAGATPDLGAIEGVDASTTPQPGLDGGGRPDSLVFDRDVSTAILGDGGRPEAGALATTDLGGVGGTDAAPLLDALGTKDSATGGTGSDIRGDARVTPLDVARGASCRRDAECVLDPAGPVCSLMTMRCGPSP